jgi:hypothetical protein
MAEFASAEGARSAIVALRERGYSELDAFTPFPLLQIERALGLPRSRLNRIVLPFALAGAVFAYWLQWFCNAVDYPLDVGGRPPHAALMFVPITFETAVLLGSLGALFAWLGLARLPELHHPVFDAPGFERATTDRFWVSVDAADPHFHRIETERTLAELGAVKVAWVGGGRP